MTGLIMIALAVVGAGAVGYVAWTVCRSLVWDVDLDVLSDSARARAVEAKIRELEALRWASMPAPTSRPEWTDYIGDGSRQTRRYLGRGR